MQFLVAIDGSTPSERALEHAIALARAAGASLTLVHAVDPEVYDEGGSAPVSTLAEAANRLIREDVDDAEERAEAVLQAAVEFAADRGVDATTELVYGDPVEAVADFAAAEGFDDVFVGHRGLSDRAERVLGSVAKGLVERSSVSVTVVK
ncbi:MAG: universal stress protein [Haloplanus sp.]